MAKVGLRRASVEHAVSDFVAGARRRSSFCVAVDVPRRASTGDVILSGKDGVVSL